MQVRKYILQIKSAAKSYGQLASRMPVTMFFATFIIGILFWGAFNTSMELTNNEGFCISCHEMKNNVYREYKDTIHYSNRTGVRATCPDCHVPKEWHYMVARKIAATNELFHKIIGSVNTKEKFDAKRLQLSEYVWKSMRETDSRECRNCHSFTFMEISNQKNSSRAAHQRAIDNNRTCIDCHMGLAHNIARDFDKSGELHAGFKRDKRPCADCHKGMKQGEGW